MLYYGDTIAMTSIGRREPLILFLGDIIIFFISLWVTLFVRYFEVPNKDILYNHIVPFSFLFIVWVLIFFIAGLYRKHTLILKRKLPETIFKAQFANILIAATFFFLIPYFGIAPKTILLIYLVVSFFFIVLWRLFVFPSFNLRKNKRAIFIGSGYELRELEEEINNNGRYNLIIVAKLDLDNLTSTNFINETENVIKENDISTIILDPTDNRVVSILPTLYSLMFLGIEILDMNKIYENIFEHVLLSSVKQNWLIDNVSLSRKVLQDTLKRVIDIVLSIVLGIVSLIFYPFVFIAIKIEDRGPIFYHQERVGKNGKTIKMIKFRSMTSNGSEDTTKVGEILRKTRIDELPQLLAVLKGDLSLIGPRPEKQDLVALYEQKIPYYNIRHLIKPGLSGWAQIHQDTPPKFGVQYDETALKLSYDLFYIKNRSLILDIQIALRTIKTLFSRSGV